MSQTLLGMGRMDMLLAKVNVKLECGNISLQEWEVHSGSLENINDYQTIIDKLWNQFKQMYFPIEHISEQKKKKQTNKQKRRYEYLKA